MIQHRRHEYLLSFLPSLDPMGSIPPMSKYDLLQQVIDAKGPVRSVEMLLLSDDLMQYQALLMEEIQKDQLDLAILSLDKGENENVLPDFLLPPESTEEAEEEKENDRLKVLLHLAQNLQTHLELDKLLFVTMEEVAKILEADRCSVFLLDENNKQLWLVGTNKSDYLDDLLTNDNVKYYESTWHVERYVKECEETASILMGRTTIEGWLCGKSGWIYQIDEQGNVLSKELNDVPSDVEKYKSENIVSEIIKEYESVI